MPRIIKRYENRKLYDTEASAYVSLADIARMVRDGETIQVVDNATGADLTAQTLTQVILEEGKRGTHPISVEALHDLLRRGGDVLDARLEGLKTGLDELVQQSLGRVGQLLQSPRQRELQDLRRQLQHLEALLGSLLDRAEPPADDAANDDTK